MEGGNQIMGNSVDKRIVDMQFNNAQFESGVQTSLKSLDNLKKGLNLEESAKSLSNLEKVGKSFSLAGIAQGVEALANKFSNLGIVGITALQNITNSAITAGKNLVKSLTVDPVRSGLEEYETKMNAITTILTNTASKGTTLKDVNRTLAELNTYSDKTIYNFAEMTRNIGTFTAAGIDLDRSAIAIKGIANLAAGSGSNAQQASTAMYQLSQALASGTVKLMDWNSVVNAGMGGELFQNALKKTAKAMGIVVDESVPFRESLQSGWITSDVLIKTLENFANDPTLTKAATEVKTFTQLIDTMKESVQSGWAQSWENIIGTKDEAAKTLTAINDAFGSIVGASADARNATLAFWHDNGGRDLLIDAISTAFKNLASVMKPIRDAFESIFPPMTGEKLIAMTQNLRYLIGSFRMTDKTAYNLKMTFKGLFAILDIGKMALSAVAKGVGDFLKKILPAGNGLLSFTGSIGEWIVALDKAIKEAGTFKVALQKLEDFLGPIAKGVGTAITAIINWFKSFGDIDLSGLTTFSDKMKARFEPFTRLFEAAGKVFEWFGSVLKKFAPVAVAIATAVGRAFDNMRNGIANAIDQADFNSLFDIVNGGILAGILLGLRKFISSIADFTGGRHGFLGGIKDILDRVKGSLTAFQQDLKANVLLKIAGAIAILAASLLVLSLIDSKKLTMALTAMTVMFTELFGSMAVFEKVMGDKKLSGSGRVAAMLIEISLAMLILSKAMENIAKLDWSGVAKGLVTIPVLLAAIAGFSHIVKPGGLIFIGMAMIELATGLLILTQAVKQLGDLKMGDLAKGLGGIVVLLAALAGFSQIVKPGPMTQTGLAIVVIASGLLILTQSVKQLGALKTDELAKGLGSVAILLASIAGFTQIVRPEKMLRMSVAMVAIGAGLLVITQSIKQLGSMDVENLAKGLGSIAVVLASIAGFSQIVKPTDIFTTSVAMIAIGAALLIMTQSIKQLGGMKVEELIKGIASIAVVLASIAGFSRIVKTDGMLKTSAAMTVMGVSLLLLAQVVKTLGSMSWEELAKGMLGLAAALGIIGAAGLLLDPVVPALIGLGIAITLIGVGCAAAGVGVLALSAGLTALALGGTSVVAALVAVGSAIIGMIPYFFKKIGEGIIEFAKAITEGAPALEKAFVALIKAAMDALAESLPIIVDTILKLVVTLLESVDKYIPQIVDKLFSIVINFLKKVAENLPELIKTGADLIKAFFEGVLNSIGAINADGILSALGAMVAVLGILTLFAASAAVALAGIVAMTGVLAALGAIKQIPGLSWLIEQGSQFLNLIGKTIGEFVGSIIGGVLNKMSDSFPKIAEKLSQFMVNLDPFLKGAATITPTMMDGVKSLIGVILGITATSVLEGLASWLTGTSSIDNFTSTLPKLGKAINQFSVNVGDLNTSNVSAGASALKTLAEASKTVAKEGGLWGLLSGSRDMNEFADTLPKLGSAVKNFSINVGDLSTGSVTAGATALKTLAEASSTVSKEGGLWGLISGERDMEGFADILPKLGTAINGFSTNIGDLSGGSVATGANALKILAEASSTVAKDGGIWGVIAGNRDPQGFVDILPKIGSAISGFSTNLGDLSASSVAEGANALKILAEASKMVAREGGIWGVIAGNRDIEGFKTILPQLGTAIRDFALNAGDSSLSGVSVWIESIKSILSLAQDMGTFGSAVSNFTNGLTALGNTSLDGFINAFMGSEGSVRNAASTMLGYVIDQLRKKQPEVVDAMKQVVIAVANSMNSQKNLFVQAGENMVKGIIEGMKNRTSDVVDAAYQLATRILTEFKNALEIHSPSRVMRDEIGRFIVQGIAEGITSDMTAEEAATKKAQNIVSAFKTELEKADLKATTAGLEEKLWTALFGESATPGQKASAQQSFLSKQIIIQQNKVDLAKSQYETLLANLGAENEETQKAYNEYLQAQIDLADLITKLQSVSQSVSQINTAAMNEYYRLLTENMEFMLKQGFTKEEIEKWAREKSGYDPNATSGMVAGLKADTNALFGDLTTVYKDQVNALFGQNLLGSFEEWGMSYAKSLGDGFLVTFKKIVEQIKVEFGNMYTTINDQIGGWLTEMLTKAQSILDSSSLTLRVNVVVDMSSVNASNLTGGNGKTPDIDVGVSDAAAKASDTASTTIPEQKNSTPDLKSEVPQQASYNFTQNNYSPTALSRLDIYRQTKNQFSAFKERMDA
jgi:tape measure domain-containing protein